MGFQTAVQINQGFGVPGELYTDAPYRAQPFTIVSALATYNVIGATACTITSQGICEAGAGGDFGFAGILIDPKQVALFGAGGIPLNPTLTVPNNTIVECLTMGTIIVTLPGVADIGDWVIYDDVTGALDTVAAGTSDPGMGKSWANAIVDYYTVTGAGLAVITVTPSTGQPLAA